jgi:hypothetical protein
MLNVVNVIFSEFILAKHEIDEVCVNQGDFCTNSVEGGFKKYLG